jgi:hypothetical protein
MLGARHGFAEALLPYLRLSSSALRRGLAVAFAAIIALAAPAQASERGAALRRLRDIVEQDAALRGRYAAYAQRCPDAAATATAERDFLARVKIAEGQTGAALAQVAMRAFADGLATVPAPHCGDAAAQTLADGFLLLDDEFAEQIEQVKAILEEEPAGGGTSVFTRPSS